MKSFLLAPMLQKYFPQLHNKIFSGVISENIQNILQTAQNQKNIILQEAADAADEYMQSHIHQLNQNLASLDLTLQQKSEKLLERSESFNVQQEKLANQANEIEAKDRQLQDQKSNLRLKNQELNSLKQSLTSKLEEQGQCSSKELFENLKEVHFKAHSYDISKISLETQEQFKQNAQKIANQALHTIYHRYQPRFIWPKSSFIVNMTNQNLLEQYASDDSAIKDFLLQNTHTQISALETNGENQFSIKINGGLGVDKEIIRLTLEECAAKKILHLDKIREIKQKHEFNLQQLIMNMGSKAAQILNMNKVHPEILKLIGSLNFRTSHRQNQYYHSLEVAVLAGMIADELGVSAQLAKRSGLLHDIGKVLDYKIEGSHAVISGDYAARYHESSDVVDTVLAHHDDKIVDTPHAYILKAADAMSGARPGARVDTEDGYNRRLDGISAVIDSFKECGVIESAIMHAGREVHVYVDNKKLTHKALEPLAKDIAAKLEEEVEYPGQIRVTVIRRMEITQVA